MLSDEGSISCGPLAAVVEWIKAVDAGQHLQEFHLYVRMWGANKITVNQKGIIEQAIMPVLLDMQAYFTRDERRKPPHVKVSVNCRGEDSDIAPIKVGLAGLEKFGLEVNNIGELFDSLFLNQLIIAWKNNHCVARTFWAVVESLLTRSMCQTRLDI